MITIETLTADIKDIDAELKKLYTAKGPLSPTSKKHQWYIYDRDRETGEINKKKRKDGKDKLKLAEPAPPAPYFDKHGYPN